MTPALRTFTERIRRIIVGRISRRLYDYEIQDLDAYRYRHAANVFRTIINFIFSQFFNNFLFRTQFGATTLGRGTISGAIRGNIIMGAFTTMIRRIFGYFEYFVIGDFSSGVTIVNIRDGRFYVLFHLVNTSAQFKSCVK